VALRKQPLVYKLSGIKINDSIKVNDTVAISATTSGKAPLGGSAMCDIQFEHPACIEWVRANNGTVKNFIDWDHVVIAKDQALGQLSELIILMLGMDPYKFFAYAVVGLVMIERMWRFASVSLRFVGGILGWTWKYIAPVRTALCGVGAFVLACVMSALTRVWKIVVWPVRKFALFIDRLLFPRPVVVLESLPAEDREVETIDLRNTKARFEVEGHDKYFVTNVMLANNVPARVLYPALEGCVAPIQKSEGYVPERATSCGRTKLLPNAGVPSCLVVFYDQTDEKILGNGARVAVPEDVSKEAVILTVAHVAKSIVHQLKAGHQVVVRKVRDNKGVEMTLSAIPNKTTVRMDQVEYGMNVDIARIPCPPSVGCSLGLTIAKIARKAVRAPEFYYQVGNETYLTAPGKTVSLQNPFLVAHTASTVPGASGCIGFRVQSGAYTAAYIHFAGDADKPVNYAINLVELYNKTQAPPRNVKSEGDDSYDEENKGLRNWTAGEFDPHHIESLHYDYHGDEAMAIDADGNASWVKGVRRVDGRVVYEFEDDEGNVSKHTWEESDDMDNYFPLGAEDQGDFDPRAAQAWAQRQLGANPRYSQIGKATKKGPHFQLEGRQPSETEQQISVLQGQIRDVGKQMSAIDGERARQRVADNAAKLNLETQLRAANAQIQALKRAAEAVKRGTEEERLAEIQRIRDIELTYEPDVVSEETDEKDSRLSTEAQTSSSSSSSDPSPPAETQGGVILESSSGMHRGAKKSQLAIPSDGNARNQPGHGHAMHFAKCVSTVPTIPVSQKERDRNIALHKAEQKVLRLQKEAERDRKKASTAAASGKLERVEKKQPKEDKQLDGITALPKPVPECANSQAEQDFRLTLPTTHQSESLLQ